MAPPGAIEYRGIAARILLQPQGSDSDTGK
jgi:hypothetical protein